MPACEGVDGIFESELAQSVSGRAGKIFTVYTPLPQVAECAFVKLDGQLLGHGVTLQGYPYEAVGRPTKIAEVEALSSCFGVGRDPAG